MVYYLGDNIIVTSSDIPHLLRRAQTHNHKGDNDAKDAPEPGQTALARDTAGDGDVHAKHATDQIQGQEDRRDNGDFCQVRIHLVALRDIVDGELGQVVGVAAREHLLEMAEIRHHRHDVILDVREIETDVTARCN